MKNEEAKEILSAYRPNGEDATDPVFEEALEQARRDPDLADWFKAERERDSAMSCLFQSIPVPEDGKRSLLAVARVKPQAKKYSFPFWHRAIAAGFAIMLVLTLVLIPTLRNTPQFALHEEGTLGVAELLSLGRSALPLDFKGDSIPELRAWLAGRGAPRPDLLPRNLLALSAVGCRVFSDENGNAISLLCLERNGNLVHLFVAEGASRQALAMAENTWINHDGWNAYCWSDGDRAYVILSQEPQNELESLVI